MLAVVEQGSFIHIQEANGFAKLDYVDTDSSSIVKLAPVGKCLHEDFDIIGGKFESYLLMWNIRNFCHCFDTI